MDLSEHIVTGPEVFETSDVESVEGIPPAEEASQDLDRSELDPENAKKHFEKSEISVTFDVTDFLDRLTNSLAGYNVHRINETRAQKLARIEAELGDLQDERLDIAEIERLTKLLEDLALKSAQSAPSPDTHSEALRGVFSQIEAGKSIRIEHKADSGRLNASTDASVLELERRLRSVEDAVGVADLQSSKSVRNHVSDLARKVDVLYDPEMDLGHIKTEIKKLSKEMDELNAKRRMAHLGHTDVPAASSTPFEVKVDAVFGILPEIQKSAALVPHLVSRLSSLHKVHSDLAHSVGVVSELDGTIESIQTEIKRWNSAVDSVSTALDVHRESFEKNRKTVEERLGEYERRMAELRRE